LPKRKKGAPRSRTLSTSPIATTVGTSDGASCSVVPELPETETIARDLDRLLVGRRIADVRVVRPDVLRVASAEELGRRCRGAGISRVWRRAKCVVIDLDSGDALLIQPRFTGVLLLEAPGSRIEDPYLAVEWTTDDGGSFRYRDIRRLGTVTLLDRASFVQMDRALGIEPLDQAFDAERLSGIVRVSRQAVKKVLMDQRRVAGVGNIYANEALWLAAIDPSRPASGITTLEAGRLREALVSVLTASIEARGTTFRDYRDAFNERGGYAERLAVYGRAGLPCQRCGTRLVETHAVDGRSTVFCFRCQG
jgi:formamidopyrimidine-DNA glycosylase